MSVKCGMCFTIRMCRLAAAHRKNRLMLLGSPPDMVHGILSHRIRTSAWKRTRCSCLSIINYIFTLKQSFFIIRYFFKKSNTKFLPPCCTCRNRGNHAERPRSCLFSLSMCAHRGKIEPEKLPTAPLGNRFQAHGGFVRKAYPRKAFLYRLLCAGASLCKRHFSKKSLLFLNRRKWNGRQNRFSL